MARDNHNSNLEERVVTIDRVSRVVKGGRRFRFRALVVVGDGQGQIGMGLAKSSDVSGAISKAVTHAKKDLQTIPIHEHGTVPHPLQVKHSGAEVFMKPAGPGTGVIAGGAVRDVVEVAGISDILTKSLGSSNKINIVYATLKALKQMRPFTDEEDETEAQANQEEE